MKPRAPDGELSGPVRPTMPMCAHCRAQISPTAHFCGFCGAAVLVPSFTPTFPVAPAPEGSGMFGALAQPSPPTAPAVTQVPGQAPHGATLVGQAPPWFETKHRPAIEELIPGTTVGEFRIECLLGMGSMGAVYAA